MLTYDIWKRTHSLAGRIRIAQIERIDLATGKSQRFDALGIARDGLARTIAHEVTERPSLYFPTDTDGGLRFEVEHSNARWYVYSY